MTPEEVLEKAAEIMAERGNAKRTYEVVQDCDDGRVAASPSSPIGRLGSVCAFGAMTLAATDGLTANYADVDVVARRLVEQAARLLRRTVYHNGPYAGDPFIVITRFNDCEKTTAEDVILAMKKAAHK